KEEKSLDSTGTPFLSKIPFIGAAFRSKTDTVTRTELMILLTPHIISGDELTTGYSRDFGYRLDKEFQNYGPFTEETPKLEYKDYQNYPGKNKGAEEVPKLKPVRP
ncbi:MAG: hypothetical protein ACM3IL_00100, partial [Deltaproteobacteria bacterium]